MPKKKDDNPVEPVVEEVADTATDETQVVTEPVQEVIEPHPEQPDWLLAMHKMFTDHTQKIDARFDRIESRLPKAEEGKKDNAQTLHTSGTGKEEGAGTGAAAETTSESKPARPAESRKPRLKLWRHF